MPLVLLSATLSPLPSMSFQFSTSPVSVPSSRLLLAAATSAAVRARFHTRRSATLPSKGPRSLLIMLVEPTCSVLAGCELAGWRSVVLSVLVATAAPSR